MAIDAETKKLFKYNSELKMYHYMFCNKEALVKDYSVSSPRNNDLILKIKKQQIITEAKAILKCKTIGIAVPTLYLIDMKNYKIIMENVSGLSVNTFLKENCNNFKAITGVLFDMGIILSKIHINNMSHGDLSTSNMLIKENGSIVLINFGLSCLDSSINEKVMDLYILEQSFINMHREIVDKFWLIYCSYKETDETNFTVVFEKLNQLKTTVMMVNSTLENKTSPYTLLGSKTELTPTKNNKANGNLLKNNDLLAHSLKKESPNSVIQTNMVIEKPSVETKMNHIKNNIFPLNELRLIIKRIDENNHKSMLSPRSLKLTEENKILNTSFVPTSSKNRLKKAQPWDHNENNEKKVVEDLLINDDADVIFNSSKKLFKKDLLSSFSSNSDDELIITDSVTPKRFRKTSDSSSAHSNNSYELTDSLPDTPRRSTRKSVNGLRKLTHKNGIEVTNIIENKRTRKSTNSLSKNNLSSISPKKKRITRSSVNQSDGLAYLRDIAVNTTKRKSVTTPSKSSNIDTVESLTHLKCARKSVNEVGESVDFNDTKIENTPKKYKKNKKISRISEDEDLDLDFENEWKTPVKKQNRLSCTPTTHSGSKTRRSILPYIPENKEIDVVSTPKTPKKTPRTHVKNLTASVSKRLDCGVRIPCSPLEKARANLHLHAAPEHLPCREVEFKSIHSFLARKINDELTGSMYISGVPGTGKTATVKKVIDSLNKDLIMKHSFKFIEINGLKLANPHQAFSVIWKELTTETVSSSRAQVLLDNYFSGNEVRELSTILLVDEVDHICNRKQDVVYNILDWPSRTGSKVVVVTIANTMDLPERVLRGCVTSRMGLTRLVFKPYTFQQLQEIIMNRLIGNSSFDPDAVQLVARKVAAVSGDARRALDICRRAIDLIKDDDDTQLITINHVNQVLNSILTGVRVTAIRYCSLFEQFFLRALRDETTRTGFDHSTIYSVYNHMKSICLLEGEELPNDQQVVMIAYRLRDNGLIFLEKKRWDLFRKVSLNISSEDISYALDKYNN